MIKAFIFDWAGTMVDFGCLVPTRAMQRAFEDAGVSVSDAVIRADMGKAKRAHIESILHTPEIDAAWKNAHGRPWAGDDVTGLLTAMEHHTVAAAAESAQPIAGALDLVAALRAKDIKIGSTTGYTRPIMNAVVPQAAKHGYDPDVMICAGDVTEGRPAPFMIWQALERLGVWPAAACVKVDDSPVGIHAGRNAGLVTVGLSASGNGVGLSQEEFAQLPDDERQKRVAASAALLTEAGADFVVNTVADIEPLLGDIEARIAQAL